MGQSESSTKKTPQKDTSKLVQSNLMNMFNKVAHKATGKSIKSIIKASKWNMAPDEMEETLPPLFHDGSESEEEIPMKPLATSSNAPDPNDDWDTYTEETTTKEREKVEAMKGREQEEAE
jgi:hypothetical protein